MHQSLKHSTKHFSSVHVVFPRDVYYSFAIQKVCCMHASAHLWKAESPCLRVFDGMITRPHASKLFNLQLGTQVYFHP